MAIVIVRALVVAVATGAGLALGPVLGVRGPSPWLAVAGLLVGILAVLLEWRARRVPVERLFWGATGSAIGIVLGLGLGSAVGAVVPGAATLARGLCGLLAGYLGWSVALAKGHELAGLSATLFPRAAVHGQQHKILDTSVIIDGRVAEVCESGFLEGPLIVPQFVLQELQQIADSPDGLKRNRGKRGFDIIQRLQRLPKVTVLIHDRDFPQVREVDRKLIELAKAMDAKVVTNDYNLHKVAQLSGVAVLNVNELAKAVKPAVLPGETMQLHVLKEGKEAGQGVAYLDDGTMVVVDQGRKLIGQSADVTVTSLLHTAAGRMIFARPVPSEEPPPR